MTKRVSTTPSTAPFRAMSPKNRASSKLSSLLLTHRPPVTRKGFSKGPLKTGFKSRKTNFLFRLSHAEELRKNYADILTKFKSECDVIEERAEEVKCQFANTQLLKIVFDLKSPLNVCIMFASK